MRLTAAYVGWAETPSVLGPCREHTRQRLRGRMRVPFAKAERLLADAAWGAVRTDEGG